MLYDHIENLLDELNELTAIKKPDRQDRLYIEDIGLELILATLRRVPKQEALSILSSSIMAQILDEGSSDDPKEALTTLHQDQTTYLTTITV